MLGHPAAPATCVYRPSISFVCASSVLVEPFNGHRSSVTIQYEVVTLAVDGWAVTFGTARRGLGRVAPRPGPSSLY